MAQDSEELGSGNEWLAGCRIIEKQSSIRLTYSFQTDAKTLQLVREACLAQPDRWKDARTSAIGEGALTGHAAELVEQQTDGLPLAVFRLDANSAGMPGFLWPSSGTWVTARGSEARSVELAFKPPQLWLFDIGLGHLVFDIEGLGSDPRAWLSALHYLRLLKPRKAGGMLRFDADPAQERAGFQQLLRSLLCSLLPSRPQWWEPADMKQQLRSFAVLYVARDRITAVVPDFERRFLYQVCELAPAGREFALPDDTAADHLRGEHYCYSKGAHFVASREGCTFVAIDADLDRPFWKDTMPDHLRKLYFVTYLLTQYQRQAIELLRRKVAKAGRDQNISADEWRDIRKLSANVKSHGYFVEVAQSNNHARFEKMVRDLAQVDRLFELTTRSVDEITSLKLEEHERLKAEAHRQHEHDLARKQRRWTIGGAGIAFASLLLTLLNVNIAGITDGDGLSLMNVLLWMAVFGAVGAGVGIVLAPRVGSRDQNRG